MKGVRIGNTLKELPHLDIVDGVAILEDGSIEVGLTVELPSVLFASSDRLASDWEGLRAILQLAVPVDSRLRFYIIGGQATNAPLDDYRQNLRGQHELPYEIAKAKLHFLEKQRLNGRLLEWRAFASLSKKVRRKGTGMSQSEFDELLETGRKLAVRLETFFRRSGIAAKRMDSQEIFNELWRWLNPSLSSCSPPRFQSLYESGTPIIPGKVVKQLGSELHQMSARAQAAGSIIGNHFERFVEVGGKYIDAVAIFNIPDETFSGMMGHILAGLSGMQAMVVTEYYHLRREPIIAKIQGNSRKFTALAGGNIPDISAAGKLQETVYAGNFFMQSGDEAYNSSMSILLASENLEELALARERAISALSVFSGSRPAYGCGLPFRLFFALAPFNGKMSHHSFKSASSVMADFGPTCLPWKGEGEPVAIYRNRFQSLTRIDPFNGSATNWNGIVVAGSGSGKTFFMQGYIASMLAAYKDLDVIIVDRGYGYAPLIEAIAGREVIIPIEPNKVSINPFDLEPGEIAPSEDKKAFLFGIIRSMIPAGDDPEVASLENALLIAAIDQVYKRKTEEIFDPVSGSYQKRYMGAQLSDLVQVLLRLDDVGGRAASERDKAIAKVLATRLQSWTGDTPFGSFVDRPTNIDTSHPIIYFETTGLSRYPDLQGPGILLLADIIWRRAAKDHQRKKLVVMDEVWAMLNIPEAKQLIVELYRRARRYNTAIYSVSQSIEDFTEVRGIVQNSNYVFLGILPNNEHARVQEVLGAPDSIRGALSSLRMVRGQYSEFVHYVFLGGRPEGEIIRVEPSALEYWIYTTNPKDMAKREALTNKGLSILEAALQLSREEP